MSSPPPRTLLISTDLPPSRGGIQTMALEIARRLPSVIGVLGPDGASIDGVDVEHARARSGPSLAVGLFTAGRRLIGRLRPDVILSLHPLAAVAGVFSRVPTVVVTHGGELRSRRIRRAARVVFPRAHTIVANSTFTRRAAIAAGAPPDKIRVIRVGTSDPVAVDASEVAARKAALGGGRILLSVARLEPHKGHDAVLDALPSLPPDVRVVLVGDGSARIALEAQARARGVADRVVFLGAMDADALPPLYAAADAFVVLSRETPGAVEGGGIALLEACSYGLPVVAGASGGVPETITHGETGLLVDPDEPAVVLDALRRVLVDDALAKRLGEAAREMATTTRTWDVFVRQLEDVLRAAAAS